MLYHIHPPTQIIHTDEPVVVAPKVAEEKMLKHRSFEGFNVQPEADYLKSRKAVLVNNDCHIVLAAPQQSMTNYFYKNADADELIFIHEGTGKYWESATQYPDRWARWIIMRTNDVNDQTFKLVSKTPGFTRYNLVEKYPFADIYEIKPEYLPQLSTEPVYGKQK